MIPVDVAQAIDGVHHQRSRKGQTTRGRQLRGAPGWTQEDSPRPSEGARREGGPQARKGEDLQERLDCFESR